MLTLVAPEPAALAALVTVVATAEPGCALRSLPSAA